MCQQFRDKVTVVRKTNRGGGEQARFYVAGIMSPGLGKRGRHVKMGEKVENSLHAWLLVLLVMGNARGGANSGSRKRVVRN